MRRTVIIFAAPPTGPATTISVTRLIPRDARVGIFPLHLDPPTVYHQQLFKMLVATPEALGRSGGGGGAGYPIEGVDDAMYRALAAGRNCGGGGGGGLANNNSRNRFHVSDGSAVSRGVCSSSSTSASSSSGSGSAVRSSTEGPSVHVTDADRQTAFGAHAVDSMASHGITDGVASRNTIRYSPPTPSSSSPVHAAGEVGTSAAAGSDVVSPAMGGIHSNASRTAPATSSSTFNAGSTTLSPYGEDWDTEALSRFARRRRLLSLLKEYRRREEELVTARGGSSAGGSSSSSVGSSSSDHYWRAARSNRNQHNYVNTNTIRSRALREEAERLDRLRRSQEAAASSSSASSSALLEPEDLLSDEEIIARLKQHVVSSWTLSRGTRTSSYGGLATALRDEIFLDSVAFGCAPSAEERELLAILAEQQEGSGGGGGNGNSRGVTVGRGGVFAHHSITPSGADGAGLLDLPSLSGLSPYDASQAQSRQLLHRRRLPCQTESEIAEQCRASVANSRFAPFDHLIILPNSKYPAPIQQSRHLAAMASLSVRNLHPRVHMELYLLEHPQHSDTAVRDLTQHFSNATIVHWLPNIADVQMWRGYTEMMDRVPLLVLRPKGFQFHSATDPTSAEAEAGETTSPSAGGADAQQPTHRFSHRAPATSTCEGSSSPSSSAAATSTSSGGSAKEPAEDCAVSSSPSKAINERLARSLRSRLNAKNLEIVEVERLSGAGVRQLLWDRGTRHEEHGVIPPVVMRYMDSHGLYRDFRKGFAQSEQSLSSLSAPPPATSLHHKGGGGGGGVGRIATSSFQATVALASLVPRLEIHYDKANMKAREQYERLRVFECRDSQDPDLIVPIGGDGYMMHCIRQNWHRFIPFFGVNAGHRGYLLNEPKRLEELFSHPLKLYHMPMLYCEAEVAVVSSGDSASSAAPTSNAAGLATGSQRQITVEEARANMANALRPSTIASGSAVSGGASYNSQDAAKPYLVGHDGKQQSQDGRIGFGLTGTLMASNSNGAGPTSPIMDTAARAGLGLAPPPPAAPAPTIQFETRTELAFNDAWIDRATGQTAWLRVIVNNTEQLKCVRGDGVLVSTAAGSTAYAQALGASPIPADVQLIQLVGSNIVSPSRWRPVHLNQSDSITLEVIDAEKRPCKCFVDSNCLGIARSLKVRTSRVASVQLAFCHSYDLQQKLYQVQFPKEDEW